MLVPLSKARNIVSKIIRHLSLSFRDANCRKHLEMPCVSTALIVGGGIAGLSSAIALARVGVKCEVLEKHDSKEGASIGVLGRAAEALDELGLYDLIYKAGTPFPHDSGAAAMRDPAGNLLSPGPARPTWPGSKEAVGIYRPTLIETMTTVAVDLGVIITQGVTFTEIDNRPDGVTLTLTNGEQRHGDIVVGADGIGSATRQKLFPDGPVPAYTGQISVRWMAPGPRVEGESWYLSPVGRLGFYSLLEGFIYVPSVFNAPENKHLSDEYLYELFSKLLDSMTAPAMVELRTRLKPDSQLIGRPFRSIFVPDSWFVNRSILVGDAAHATTAHMSMGGGMALEDAVVLGQCVRDASTVNEAFKNFMARRYERVSTVVHTSVELSRLEQAKVPPMESRALLGKAFGALAQPY